MSALTDRVAALEARIDELSASLAREVRTERIVVVHPDDGRELVYTERLPDAIGLHVSWRGTGVASVDITSGTDHGDGDSSIDDATVGVFAGGNNAVMVTGEIDEEGSCRGYMYLEDRPNSLGGADETMRIDASGISRSSGAISARARFEVRS